MSATISRPGRNAVAAAATAVAVLAGAASAAAAPHAGDWEATGTRGALASFEVTSGAHGKRAIEDLVVQAPIGCTNAFSTPLPIDVEVINGPIQIGSRGTFSSGGLKRDGAGTLVTGSLHGGSFAIHYRHDSRTVNAYEGGEEICNTGTIHLTARPGHRHTVRDGVWEGDTSEQEPVELNVVAGGRALVSPGGLGPGGTKFYAFEIAGSSSTDDCSYSISYPLFLEPNDTFSNSATRLGDEAVVSGSFSGTRKISGQFSNEEESCPTESWSASWYLASP